MLQQLAKYIEEISFNQLSETTIEKTKTAVLNYFGASLPGAKTCLTLAESKLWDSPQKGASVIIGHIGKTSALAAAAINASMGAAYLLEDCHDETRSHPGTIVIPVAIAIAQEFGLNGKELISAIVAGYELIARIGAAIIVPGFVKNGLRPASILAPLGSAAVAAKLFHLSPERITAAIAIAANTSSGVMEFVNAGTEDICIQNCFAAKNGIMAAILAKQGVRAAPSILDGRFGLGSAFAGDECDWSKIWRTPKMSFAIDNTTIKAYPGCGHVQPTAQAGMSIVRTNDISPQDVCRVTVEVSHPAKIWPGVDNKGPFRGTISAMMSHQFMVASALIHKEISVRTVDAFDNNHVISLAQRIELLADDRLTELIPQHVGARVVVYYKNGNYIEDYQPDIIPLNRNGVMKRFRSNAEPYFKADTIENIIQMTLQLDILSDINMLANLLEKSDNVM